MIKYGLLCVCGLKMLKTKVFFKNWGVVVDYTSLIIDYQNKTKKCQIPDFLITFSHGNRLHSSCNRLPIWFLASYLKFQPFFFHLIFSFYLVIDYFLQTPLQLKSSNLQIFIFKGKNNKNNVATSSHISIIPLNLPFLLHTTPKFENPQTPLFPNHHEPTQKHQNQESLCRKSYQTMARLQSTKIIKICCNP